MQVAGGILVHFEQCWICWVQVAVAGLDCNRSEVVQECLERLVGEQSQVLSSDISVRSYLVNILSLSDKVLHLLFHPLIVHHVTCYQNNLDPAV